MLWDTHMHTHHSGDSDALMPDMIQAAVRQNLDGICFTDHFDYDYPDDPNLFLLDFDSYIKEVRSFQDTCRDRLSIRLGIEVGLQPHITEINRKAVTGHPFDFVIGSSHVVHGIDPYYPKYYEGRSEKTAYREYFESILENLLKLVSRMIIRCDCAEDEELIALSSHVYRQGIYDEVILMYLMKFRFGPVDELLDIWKSACGFDMDTYNLEERILSLLMFNWDYRPEGEDILKAYIRHSGKESVIGAYLTLMSYGMFVKEMPEMPGLKEYLKNRREKEWPGDRICDLTLLKLLSEEKTADEENLEMEEKILSSCVKEGMLFEFFRNLDQSILRPYQLDDKTFVEYHTSPEASVTLYYSLDTGLGTVPDYKSEPLKNIYEGIFARAFTLFYGETLRYYFQTEDETGVHKTEEKILTMNQSNDQASSKYQLINQILPEGQYRRVRQ